MTHAQAIPPIPIWIWLILAGVFVGIPLVIIGIAVLLRAYASRSAMRQADGPPQAARMQARRARWYGLAGLGIGVLLGVALVVGQRGGLAPLACAGGYLVGLLVGEYAGQPPAAGQVRAATLRPRRPSDYSPHWAATAVLLAALLALAAPVAFAAAPSISYGRWQPAPGAGFSLPGGRTEWPSWPLTTAAAALAVGVMLLGVAGLRRVAARPRLISAEQDPAGQGLDELLRRQSGRAITGAVLGLELLVLAAVLVTGSSGLAVPVPAASAAAYLGNRLMVYGGLGCAACAAGSWLVLSGWIRRTHRGSRAGGHAGPGGPDGPYRPGGADGDGLQPEA
jgi:hypothetical protein